MQINTFKYGTIISTRPLTWRERFALRRFFVSANSISLAVFVSGLIATIAIMLMNQDSGMPRGLLATILVSLAVIMLLAFCADRLLYRWTTRRREALMNDPSLRFPCSYEGRPSFQFYELVVFYAERAGSSFDRERLDAWLVSTAMNEKHFDRRVIEGFSPKVAPDLVALKSRDGWHAARRELRSLQEMFNSELPLGFDDAAEKVLAGIASTAEKAYSDATALARDESGRAMRAYGYLMDLSSSFAAEVQRCTLHP